MTATAEETSNQATAVAAATEEASTNVQTVAAASEELASSVTEISRQVAQSAAIAQKAVSEADRTNATVQGLFKDAASIGDVVKLINEIAEPDQPSRAQCHDRGGARRRGRQGICRGGGRGQEPRRTNREGHRTDRRPDLVDPDFIERSRQRHQGHLHDDQRDERDRLRDCQRGGRAGLGDAGDRTQRAAGGARHRRNLVERRRRPAGRRRYRRRRPSGAAGVRRIVEAVRDDARPGRKPSSATSRPPDR